MAQARLVTSGTERTISRKAVSRQQEEKKTMPDAQQDLRTELSKLKALNTIIMECYSRLSPLEKPTVAEHQDEAFGRRQRQYHQPISIVPGTLYRRTLTKVSLNYNQWSFEYDSASANKSFVLPPVEKHL
ncbi:hypothetical protein PROFUN_11365, partial [Planoprotostelium fungivorum]